MHTSSFNLRTEAELARLRPDFIRWLDRWRWTHFVTLLRPMIRAGGYGRSSFTISSVNGMRG